MPNIFELMTNRSPQIRNSYYVRQERIKREGSQYFTWEVPVTAAGATSIIYVPDEFPASRKYQPLDFLELTNNEAANDLTLTINQGEAFLIPAQVIKTIVNKPLWHLAVTNNGGVNTTLGAIVVQIRREPMTIDKWSRKQ